ncbi:MAG: hypothetical protein II937_03895 [Bacteroidales bacterium]|nr:hypothetical protein [Bacteroidales bacterium]
MKKFLYYSLIAAMTASSVALSSCDDEEEVDSIINNNSDNTQKDGTKFSVTVTLDNKTIFTKEGETGKSITLDLDKLAEEPLLKEALKGYEILSFTKDGKEISGEQTITADAKYEINAIKIAFLEYTLPEDGKLLYEKEVEESDDLKMKKGIRKIDIQEQPVDIQVEPTTYETWYYTTSNNQIEYIIRQSEIGIYDSPIMGGYTFDATTGKLYDEALRDGDGDESDNNFEAYLFKVADKYYTTPIRYKKSKDGVKGYQTEWTIENADRIIGKNAVVEDEDEDEDLTAEDLALKFTADKVTYAGLNIDYKYQDGIITFSQLKTKK